MEINFDSIVSYEEILTYISEKDIYDYYLGESILENRLYKCPFHKDSNPSLGFKLMSSGMLLHRCFGCGESGSANNFVSKIFGYTRNEANQKIHKDLILGLRKPVSYLTTPSERVKCNGFTTEDDTVSIIPIIQSFTITDYLYWKQYHITLNTLLEYSISSCKEVYIKRKDKDAKLFAEYYNTNPIYCYQVGSKHKIYRPLNPTKGGKWLNTCKSTDIQGMIQLPKNGNLLIITSSMKDLLVLRLFGYNAIALGGEGNKIPANILDYLYASFKELLVFYDNDGAGIKYGEKLASDIGSNYIYIPTEYTEKDVSDFINIHGKDQTGCLLNKLINDRNKI